MSLEQCDVEKDIIAFVKERSTGQEIPDPPKYINFLDGNSAYSLDHDNYSLAQFPRASNPQYRTRDSSLISGSEEVTQTAAAPHSSQIDFMLASLSVLSPTSAENQITSKTPVTSVAVGSGGDRIITARENTKSSINTISKGLKDSVALQYPDETLSSAHSSPVHRGRSPSGESNFSQTTTISSGSDNELSTPTKKRTNLLTKLDKTPVTASKKKSGWTSPFKRKSKNDIDAGFDDDECDYIRPNNTSSYAVNQVFSKSSFEPSSRSSSPGKSAVSTPYGSLERYGSTPIKYGMSDVRGTPASERSVVGKNRSSIDNSDPSDPRAQYVLSVGDNAFEVSPSKSKNKNEAALASDAEDPIAAALANLKGGEMHIAPRVFEKQYGIGSQHKANNGARRVPSYSAPTSPQNNTVKSNANGVPPPSHMRQPDFEAALKQSNLMPPAQAITAQELRNTAHEYATKTQEIFQGPNRGGSRSYQGRGQVVTTGYSPQQRPVQQREQQQYRPPSSKSQYNSPVNRGSSGYDQQHSQQQQEPYRSRSRADLGHQRDMYFGEPPQSAVVPQSISPNPQTMSRPRSAFAYASSDEAMTEPTRSRSRVSTYEGSPSGVSPQQRQQRPVSRQYQQSGSPRKIYQNSPTEMYDRPKSKSALDVRRPEPIELPQFSRDGREVIAYARALYDYRAMIPEEVTFRKGDMMLVLLMQEDGWWETEVLGPRARPQLGLAPSNFLQTV